MELYSVFIHGINPIIKIFHRQTSDYYTFDKTIKFLAHKVKSGKIAETTRPRREYLILTAPQNQIDFVQSCDLMFWLGNPGVNPRNFENFGTQECHFLHFSANG